MRVQMEKTNEEIAKLRAMVDTLQKEKGSGANTARAMGAKTSLGSSRPTTATSRPTTAATKATTDSK